MWKCVLHFKRPFSVSITSKIKYLPTEGAFPGAESSCPSGLDCRCVCIHITGSLLADFSCTSGTTVNTYVCTSESQFNTVKNVPFFWLWHTICSYFAFVSQPPNPVLSKTPLHPTLSTHSSLILLRVQNRPSECLPFSPNHFKAAVLQWFSFLLPYSNTVAHCPQYGVICHPPPALQHLFHSLIFIPCLLFTLLAMQTATYRFFSPAICTITLLQLDFTSYFAPLPPTPWWHSVL